MITDLLILFGLHFLADFVLQSREMGKGKSEDIEWLWIHFIIIFIIFLIGSVFVFLFNGTPDSEIVQNAIRLSLGISVIHCFQDWFIWRGYKNIVKIRIMDEDYESTSSKTVTEKFRDWKYWEDKLFYDTIGIDQALHYITILLVYNWVM